MHNCREQVNFEVWILWTRFGQPHGLLHIGVRKRATFVFATWTSLCIGLFELWATNKKLFDFPRSFLPSVLGSILSRFPGHLNLLLTVPLITDTIKSAMEYPLNDNQLWTTKCGAQLKKPSTRSRSPSLQHWLPTKIRRILANVCLHLYSTSYWFKLPDSLLWVFCFLRQRWTLRDSLT